MQFETPITIEEALDRIHRRVYVLPAIQREFVWKPLQIERLFDSLMREYPIGAFLFWEIKPEHSGNYLYFEFVRTTGFATRTTKRSRFPQSEP